MAILKKTPKLNYRQYGFCVPKYDMHETGSATRDFWFCGGDVMRWFPDIGQTTKDLIFIAHDRPAAERIKIEKADAAVDGSWVDQDCFKLDGTVVEFATKAARTPTPSKKTRRLAGSPIVTVPFSTFLSRFAG